MVRLAWVELGLAASLLLADWMWVLPRTARGAGLLVLLTLGAVDLVRRVARGSFPQGRAETAAEVEAHFPHLGQRVRTTVEYAEPAPFTAPASPRLIAALVRDTDFRTADLDFRSLIPWKSLKRQTLGLVLVVLGGLVLLMASSSLRTAALRLLLLPAYFTRLEVEPAGRTIRAGDDFTVTVTLSGRPVKSVSWLYRKAGTPGPWTSSAMALPAEAETSSRPLIGTLPGC
jgi:hypothetical protein